MVNNFRPSGFNPSNRIASSPRDAIRGVFAPSQIAGLQLWLDASDPSMLYQDSSLTTPAAADGDVVGGWKDKSGNARNATQGTTAAKPVLKLAQTNGRNVVRFDGADDFLTLASALSSMTGALAVTVIAAIVPDLTGRVSTNGGAGIVRRYPGSDAAGSWYAGVRGDGALAINHHLVGGGNGAGATRLTGQTVVTLTPTIATFSWDTSAMTLRKDGATGAQATAGTSTGWGSGDEVGRGFTTGAFFYNRDICELLVYGALTSTERQSAERYLGTKWGITVA